MNELALFAGAGGGILGGKLLGWRTVCAVELETFRCERLADRQNDGLLPPFPIWCGDIAEFDGRPWRGIVDVVSGGFPCQDISAANPNAVGITGARSGLWKEMRRIICEVGPRSVLVENSPVLTRRGLGTVLGDLAALGYNVRWGVLGADDMGGYHKRERIFIVGHTDQEGLEGLAGHGNPYGKPDSAGYVAPSGIRILANGHIIERRAEHEQQISEGERPRKQSERSGEDVADDNKVHGDRSGHDPSAMERQRSGATKLQRSGDSVWGDVEHIECQDGKIRASKPGLCGMADGVANRMDRLAAIGDGQVPCVVAAAWNLLSE